MPWYPMCRESGIAMPYIRARVDHDGQRATCRFLVDSGAAISVAPMALASRLLGADAFDRLRWPRTRLPVSAIQSASGAMVREALALPVSIAIDGLAPIDETLWFIEGWHFYLLGHSTWFERVCVTFPTEARIPPRFRGQGRHFAISPG